MNDINEIITQVVKGCKNGGIEVSEVLAAFVARTIVESKSSTFALDRRITPEGIEEVILQSIERLLEKDNPALELVKMQVDYDSTYLKEDTEAEKKLRLRNKMILTHKTEILEVEMEDANDFEALTTLYRKIFKFLVDFSPNSKASDRNIENEIAAALESVFPRVGLKAFIMLSNEEKASQLLELSRIILGIRLFNREEGRGGAGIDNMDKDGKILAGILSQDIDREVEFFSDACDKYQKAIIKAHATRRRKKYEHDLEVQRASQMDSDFDTTIPDEIHDIIPKIRSENKQLLPEPNDAMLERWSKELANRRQYLGFLRILQDETHLLNDKILNVCEKIKIELNNIKALVNNKTSVPKEVVYPRFDSLGSLWLQLYDEIVVMVARSNTFQALCKYRLSFIPTLSEAYYIDSEPNENMLYALYDVESKNIDILDNKNILNNNSNSQTANPTSILKPISRSENKSERKYDNNDQDKRIQAVSTMSKDEDKTDEDSKNDVVLSPPKSNNKNNDDVLPEYDNNDNNNVDTSDINAQMKINEEKSDDQSKDLKNDDKKDDYDNNNDEKESKRVSGQLPSLNKKDKTVTITDTIATVDPRFDSQASVHVYEGNNVKYDEIYPSGACLLSIQTTPDFMLLPLEFQGYCPWTIVETKGLLLPGRPTLGIVRYDNQYYVFDHMQAIKTFMKFPERYLDSIKERALRNPEFIHLLRLQRWFPTASISKLLKSLDSDAQEKSQPRTRDASTSTPTHFLDTYIDINYHWNEWELRRRALKIINLKNCVTTSAQTDKSHFRRDTDTQVFEPRENSTQTKRDKGTNPPVVTTYLTGFRGKKHLADDESGEEEELMEDSSKKAGDINIRSESKNLSVSKSRSVDEDKQFKATKPLRHTKVGVVTLTLDL
eukprot:gene7181-9792_t